MSVGHVATGAQVDAAVSAARQALESWRRTPLAERGRILVAAAARLDESASELGGELTREEGKTIAEGIGEVRRAAQVLRYCAGEAERDVGELYASGRGDETISVLRRPRGVVGVITPWNFPIAIPAWKIAPAIMFGNSVVWKPATNARVLATRLAGALHEAGLPPGVLSLVIGGGAVGEAVATHSGVDALTFTGSTRVGRHLIAACACKATPVQAEMGGKNAALVLRDAAIEETAGSVWRAAMSATGQKCTATSRLIVERDVAADVFAALERVADAWVVGDGQDPGVHMGPAVSPEAQAEILKAIAGADRFGTVRVGGTPYPDGPLAGGAFVPPTVVELTDCSSGLWRDEIFGPVLSVVVVDTADRAIELANDSDLGLSASIFTNDLRMVNRAIESLEVGVIHINSETTGAEPHVPFGGTRGSGYGPHEQGRASREFFTKTVTVYQRAAGQVG